MAMECPVCGRATSNNGMYCSECGEEMVFIGKPAESIPAADVRYPEHDDLHCEFERILSEMIVNRCNS
jgi:predicted amidophosphoribosyltransferase